MPVAQGLSNPVLGVAAASAFKEICESCDQLLADSLDQVLPACTTAIGTQALPPKTRRLIMDSVCVLLSAVPVESQLGCFQQVLGPVLESVQRCVGPPAVGAPCVRALHKPT